MVAKSVESIVNEFAGGENLLPEKQKDDLIRFCNHARNGNCELARFTKLTRGLVPDDDNVANLYGRLVLNYETNSTGTSRSTITSSANFLEFDHRVVLEDIPNSDANDGTQQQQQQRLVDDNASQRQANDDEGSRQTLETANIHRGVQLQVDDGAVEIVADDIPLPHVAAVRHRTIRM